MLIGVGTIGSNLANILIRNGAGTGNYGTLTLVDNDVFEPYNFSRHFLGLNSSGILKVDALTEELLRLAPFCKIIPEKKSIYDFPIKPNKYDLIIDSTGEEALTIWLNDQLYKIEKLNNGLSTLFLSVWVRGMGKAVECFSKTDNQKSCQECFRMSEFSVKESDQEYPLRDSCRSVYVPFPVTTSLYASLLAIHVINKWLDRNLDTSNYFKQNINPVGAIEEFFIPMNKECPSCGNSYIEE